MRLEQRTIEDALAFFCDHGIVSATERDDIVALLDEEFPFAAALGAAETLHLHIKVDDVDALPHSQIQALGVQPENETPGYTKYSFPSGINMIFSSFPISQDDLIDGAVTLPTPFMDHVGVDIRDEAAESEKIFNAIPDTATDVGWRHVPQDGPVHCHHTEVSGKHWVYPPEGWPKWRRPIEIAFGELKIYEEEKGCNLRPMDPGHPMAAQVGICGTSACSAVKK